MATHVNPIDPLPEDSYNGSGPDVTISYVDWEGGQLPENTGLYAAVLDNVLTQNECETLIEAVEAKAKQHLAKSYGEYGQWRPSTLYKDERNCGRLFWDFPDLAARIWTRVETYLQSILRLEDVPRITGIGPPRRREVMTMRRLNERLRFLKYTGGEYFRPHCDANYENERKERSYFTLHMYLNSEATGDEPLKGGATRFHSLDMNRYMDVSPKAGRVLVFQQRDLLHSGDDVLSGTKYTMRTDILYAKEEGIQGRESEHLKFTFDM